MKVFHEIKRFVFTGVANTAIGAALIALFQYLTANPYLANLLGYSMGGAIAYCLHARFTFRSGMSLRGIALFGLVASLAYLLNLFILNQSLRTMGILPAQAIAMTSYTAFSYVFQSRLSFPASQRSKIAGKSAGD